MPLKPDILFCVFIAHLNNIVFDLSQKLLFYLRLESFSRNRFDHESREVYYGLNFLRKALNAGMNMPALRKFILRMVTHVKPKL